MKRISHSLLAAFKNGNDAEARENMAFASMLGGLALANVKLGAVHGFAGPMGGMFPIAHGAICACLLPAVMKMNISVLGEQNESLSKYNEVAQILSGNAKATANDGIACVENLIRELKIPTLSDFGISKNDFPELLEKAKNASSMKGNPVVLSDEQLTWILEESV